MTRNNFEFNIAGITLKGQYYEPKEIQAVVILVHGMGEYSRRYERTVVPFLLKASIAVLSYDQFGHGYSQGKKGHNPGFEYLLDAIDAMAEKAAVLFPTKPLFLYGHSMGGNVVINYTLSRTSQITGTIATSPFLKLAFEPPKLKMFFGKLIDRIYPSLTLPNELDLQYLSHDQDEIKAYENDPLIHDKISTRYSLEFMKKGICAIEHAASLKTPMIIFHGTKDQITSHLASKEFAAASQGMAKYFPVENGYHELHHDLDRDMVLDQICIWIKKQTSNL